MGQGPRLDQNHLIKPMSRLAAEGLYLSDWKIVIPVESRSSVLVNGLDRLYRITAVDPRTEVLLMADVMSLPTAASVGEVQTDLTCDICSKSYQRRAFLFLLQHLYTLD